MPAEEDPTPQPEDEIEWTCHPARHRPVALVGVTAFVLLLTLGIHLSFGDAFLTGLSMVILSISLSPFYLPTGYRMTQDRAFIRTVLGTRDKPLDLFRRWQVDRYGILLSPFDRPSRLDRFHGLNLRFDGPDRERVLDYIQRRFDKNDPED